MREFAETMDEATLEKLRRVTEHPNWKNFENELEAWISSIQAQMEVEPNPVQIYRLQGNVESIRHMVNFRTVMSEE